MQNERKFPSPYGDFVFQQMTKVEVVSKEMKKFPSPYGDFVFQQHRSLQTKKPQRKFPSPYGDFVFQLGVICIANLIKFLWCFRPLTGILFFNVFRILSVQGPRLLVSVPLRGFCFSTMEENKMMNPMELLVSVPLRGFCFSTR